MAGRMPGKQVLMDKITLTDITETGNAAQDEPAVQYAEDQVSNGKEVTLHFELALEDGKIVDSNFDGQPATFRPGDGNLPPGFEQVLFGLRQGEEKTVKVSEDDAFGPYNPDNVQTFPRYRFQADLAMEDGLVINFADQAGNEQAGVITAFDSEKITVDFNHPLAGRNILFRVKILSVKP